MPTSRLNAVALDALLQAGTPLSLPDARDPQAYAQGHLDGALRLDRDSLDGLLLSLPKARPVLIYCHHGHASQVYAGMFRDFRFTQVQDLIGGWAAWQQHRACGAPVPDADPPGPALPRGPAALVDWMRTRGYGGEDLEERLGKRTTPLMQAAREGEVQALEQLIAAGADVNATNADGNTALWLACFAERLDALDRLIEAGAQVDHANDNEATCLMFASSTGKVEIVRRLLRAGADLTLRTLDDDTALDMASTLDCLRLLREAERRALASRAASL